MRRTTFLALVAALLIAPAAAHAAGDPTEIIRDCADDGVMQGDYTPSELRRARNQLPTDIDEYSDCRDVLSRAIEGSASNNNSDDVAGGGGGGATGGVGGGGTDPGAGSPGVTQADPSTLSDTSSESGKLPAPYTSEEHAAVTRAAAEGALPVDLAGHKVAPGTHLAADVGRNDIPGALVVVLALLAAATIGVAGPALRRRVLAHRKT
jgi:hypothetical protein